MWLVLFIILLESVILVVACCLNYLVDINESLEVGLRKTFCENYGFIQDKTEAVDFIQQKVKLPIYFSEFIFKKLHFIRTVLRYFFYNELGH